ncbi:unnamed protein product [Coccothraustes coccothraustes]
MEPARSHGIHPLPGDGMEPARSLRIHPQPGDGMEPARSLRIHPQPGDGMEPARSHRIDPPAMRGASPDRGLLFGGVRCSCFCPELSVPGLLSPQGDYKGPAWEEIRPVSLP